MTAPLGQLLSDSWGSFRRALLALAIGALIFGLILGISQSFVGQRMVQKTGSALEGLGFDQQQMQDLQRRIQEGDQAAFEEFSQQMQQLGGAQGEAVSGALVSMYKGLLPAIGASVLIMWVISLIASAYFLLIALNDKLTFQAALAKTPGLIIPLFLLSLWIMIRSFVWIPILGIILAIILGPRFVCAPVILARDHKGVLESASMSYAKTSGYWGKILRQSVRRRCSHDDRSHGAWDDHQPAGIRHRRYSHADDQHARDRLPHGVRRAPVDNDPLKRAVGLLSFSPAPPRARSRGRRPA